ncbi:hypothetical protein F511_42697 [Dorcoceras hygrometricum]|uniref:Uncharacterized protein n=1 Tax=Dorcoceras hygrometricum TaxID=472368 RepID=A0A2Z7D2Y4_9LAMI|nr:hypothetical protein F511_42697 [Dorcoceras hygrometricum]
MASSFVSNTNQVLFASVLAIDKSEMVAMFEALVASGLNGFLGCMSDIFDAALIEFYQNASVRDGKVVSTVQEKLVEISEEVFSRTFQLSMEGLININEVPKELIFDARTEFSFTGEQLSTFCKKRELKIEYRLLSDIVAKSITVKAGSFDSVTHERFLIMTAIFGGVAVNWGRFLFKIFKDMMTPKKRQAKGYAVHICILLKTIPDLELGDSEEFPPLKILTAKTVGRYIAIKEKIAVETVEGLAGKSLKKTPVKRAVSKKRPAVAIDEQVVKKKRTLKGKAAPSKAPMELISVALDVEPIQTIDPTSAFHPLAPKRKAPKRKLRMTANSFNDLRTSMPRIISLQSKESRRSADSHNEVLDKIKQLEKTILDAFYQQNHVFHRLITGIHQADANKEAKERKDIIKDMDERLATLRSQQLDFRAQAQENYNNLSSQLGELVSYINRDNDKKGEGSSSRRPQPPPDDQNRPIGGNANRGGGGGGSSGSGRRDDRKGSSTKKGSGSSGAGGPYKKNAEWCIADDLPEISSTAAIPQIEETTAAIP